MAKYPPVHLRALLLSFLLVGSSFGTATPTAAAEYPCRITVRTTMKSGTEKKRVFPAKSARSAAECAEQAKLYETNFYSPGIVKKEVDHAWNAREEGVRE